MSFRSEIKLITTVAAGISLCGITGYFLYLLFKNDNDDDDFNYLPLNLLKSTVKMKIPREYVRTVIGRNGCQIRKIELQSQTKICFKEQRSDEEFRICVIRGLTKQCTLAESLIQDLIANLPVIEIKEIWVPQASIGRIIGRCGERINYFSQLSGAKCHVAEVDATDAEGRRRIIIKGTNDQIESAKSFIIDIVKEDNAMRQKIESKLAKREPRIKPKIKKTESNIVKQAPEKLTTNIAGGDGQMEVYVSAVVDPSQFWLQFVGPKANELDQLVEEMTEYYSKQENRELHIIVEPCVGDIVAAVFMYDGKWYRSEITELKIELDRPYACLYYLDYGDTDTVPLEEIYELRTDFLRLRFQAIECFLARVKPIDDKWSEEAIDKFEEMTQVAQWKKLRARVSGYKDRGTGRLNDRATREGSPIPGVDLYNVNQQEDLDIAIELIKCGYALPDEVRSISRTKMSSSSTSISSKSVDEHEEHIVNGKKISPSMSDDLTMQTNDVDNSNGAENNFKIKVETNLNSSDTIENISSENNDKINLSSDLDTQTIINVSKSESPKHVEIESNLSNNSLSSPSPVTPTTDTSLVKNNTEMENLLSTTTPSNSDILQASDVNSSEILQSSDVDLEINLSNSNIQ